MSALPESTMVLHPIGIIHSPHSEPARTPIQPVFAHGADARAEILPEFEEGLADLDGFSHLWLLYWLHRSGAPDLTVRPFLDDTPRGLFATRAPRRPNPIGLSLVRLQRREGHVLYLTEVDLLDGTPLLDIKPYVTRFDVRHDARCGWTESVDEATARARGRRGFQPPRTP